MPKIYKNKKELIESSIKETGVVLDVGFWGQGVNIKDANWPHRLFLACTKNVYGLDINFDESQLVDRNKYKKGSAENFNFDIKFDAIFAGDVIEHLSNPGLFLRSCRDNLKEDGRLIITTPNCFNLFNLAEKITKTEPTINRDHTCYFNLKTLQCLLAKNNFFVAEASFLYSLGNGFEESWKKKFLNVIYFLASKITPKFLETLVIVAKKNENILSDKLQDSYRKSRRA